MNNYVWVSLYLLLWAVMIGSMMFALVASNLLALIVFFVCLGINVIIKIQEEKK